MDNLSQHSSNSSRMLDDQAKLNKALCAYYLIGFQNPFKIVHTQAFNEFWADFQNFYFQVTDGQIILDKVQQNIPEPYGPVFMVIKNLEGVYGQSGKQQDLVATFVFDRSENDFLYYKLQEDGAKSFMIKKMMETEGQFLIYDRALSITEGSEQYKQLSFTNNNAKAFYTIRIALVV